MTCTLFSINMTCLPSSSSTALLSQHHTHRDCLVLSFTWTTQRLPTDYLPTTYPESFPCTPFICIPTSLDFHLLHIIWSVPVMIRVIIICIIIIYHKSNPKVCVWRYQPVLTHSIFHHSGCCSFSASALIYHVNKLFTFETQLSPFECVSVTNILHFCLLFPNISIR